jgi:ankyrin repeat protein
MHHLLSLPVEVHDLIAGHLEYASELNALAKTCRGVFNTANRRLYKLFAKDCSPRGFSKIVKNKNVAALRKILPLFLDRDCDEEGFFEGETKKLELDMAEKLLAIIQIFIDLYGPQHDFHIIANPECAKAVLAPEDLLVLKVLSGAVKCTMTGVLALQIAAKKGSLACVKFLLGLGCDVDATDDIDDDDMRETALMKAAAKGHLEIVKLLHEAGADLNFTIDPDWGVPFCETPLLFAAVHNHEAVVRYLLENQAHLGIPGEINPFELGTLIEHDGRLPLAKLILDSIDNELPPLSLEDTSRFIRHAILLGEDAALEAFTGHDSLHDASTNGFAHLVDSLPDLNPGNELNGEEMSEPLDIIHLATDTNDQPTVAAVLDRVEKLGFLPAARFALLHAAQNRQEAMCQFLVEERDALDDNLPDGSADDQIPLILDAAITTGNDTLIKHIMDIRGYHLMESPDWVISPGGDTILEMVAEKGSMDLFQKALSWGGPIEPGESVCNKALLRATSKGKIEIVSYFLQHGFDINGTYRTEALEYGQDSDDDYDPYEDHDLYRDITLLMQSVFPWDRFDLDRQTPAMAEFLIDQGAKVDAVGSKGRTALAEVARQCGDISLAKLLIERGANPLTGVERSESALEWAILRNYPELVELSLQTISARGYQSSYLDDTIRHYSSIGRGPLVTGPTTKWRWFFVVKALKQFYWRSRYPVPDGL